jgi:hypothetical protein
MASWPLGPVAKPDGAPAPFEGSSASSETLVVSPRLLATLTSETTLSQNRYTRSTDSISIMGVPSDDEEVDARLQAKQVRFFAETTCPVDEDLARSLLARLAAHDELPEEERAHDLELAREELLGALGVDIEAMEQASIEAGRWMNIHMVPTDLLSLAPLVLRSVLGKTPLSESHVAWTLLAAQASVQAVSPYFSARLMMPVLEIQRQLRSGISVRYGATGQFDADIRGMYKEAAELNGILTSPLTDMSQLESQTDRLKAQIARYEDSANLNKLRYTTYLPENLVRMLRATMLAGGLWVANAAQRPEDKTPSTVPYALLFQVTSIAAAWVLHWVWAGPQRDRLLRDELLKTDLKKFGPEIAHSLMERRKAQDPGADPLAPDDTAKDELRKLWKPQMTARVGMAATLFRAEQRQLESEKALLNSAQDESLKHLQRELSLVADDLVSLESGHWTDIQPHRKKLLDSVLSDTPNSNTLSMFSRFLFGSLVGDTSDLIKTAERLAANARSQFQESAPITLLKYDKAFQMIFGGSATALGIAAAQKLLAAYGIHLPPQARVAATVVPLFFVYASEFTGGVLVNQVLTDRTEWRARFAHQQPTTAEKFALSMKSFVKGIVSTPREAWRLASGAVASRYSKNVLETATARIDAARQAEHTAISIEPNNTAR